MTAQGARRRDDRDEGGATPRRQRPSRQTDARAAPLSERHGLTPQEARVALLVADARTVKEIAVMLDVTVFTVRAHLRNIFVKMGVTRQAALVRAVLTTTETEQQD